ncbi:MAG: pyridoxal kinase [Rhizobiales bacterium]|nr:pyridoxal kinase [Hyphomicrobiales bacterium]
MSTILSISSQVVMGAVGNSASSFPLMRLGHNVWPIPSLILSHHPGLGRPQVLPVAAGDIEAMGANLDELGLLAQCDALISGYLAHADQAGAIEALLGRLRRANPEAIYLCDPICGDAEEGSYVSEGITDALRHLAGLADIITPNIFELGVLAGCEIRNTGEAIAAARSLKCSLVVATSSPADAAFIASLAITADHVWRCQTPKHLAVAPLTTPKGTGDLFAALFLGHHLNGMTVAEAMACASATTADMVAFSIDEKSESLLLGPGQQLLEQPLTACAIESL